MNVSLLWSLFPYLLKSSKHSSTFSDVISLHKLLRKCLFESAKSIQLHLIQLLNGLTLHEETNIKLSFLVSHIGILLWK